MEYQEKGYRKTKFTGSNEDMMEFLVGAVVKKEPSQMTKKELIAELEKTKALVEANIQEHTQWVNKMRAENERLLNQNLSKSDNSVEVLRLRSIVVKQADITRNIAMLLDGSKT